MGDVAFEHIQQAQHLRLSIYQRQHNNAKGILHLGVLVKLI